MSSEWHSHQDMVNDIWFFSEIEGAASSTKIDVTPPTTILNYNARLGANNTPSVFDPVAHEDVTYVLSGRGRGGISTLIKPGIVPDTGRNVEDDLKRRLREVSGLGYSNDLIMQSLKEVTNNKSRTTTPEIRLQPTEPLNSCCSKRSTPNNVNLSSPSNSTNSSPGATPKTSTPSDLNISCSSSSSAVSEVSSSECKSAVPKTFTPLPLSVMRNRAKMKKKAEQSSSAKMKENKNTEIKSNRKMEEDGNINTNRKHLKFIIYPNENSLRNGSDNSSSDDSNSWQRIDGNSLNRYCDVKNIKTSTKSFNLGSSKDFPALK